jgi:hypothetical protein
VLGLHNIGISCRDAGLEVINQEVDMHGSEKRRTWGAAWPCCGDGDCAEQRTTDCLAFLPQQPGHGQEEYRGHRDMQGAYLMSIRGGHHRKIPAILTCNLPLRLLTCKILPRRDSPGVNLHRSP